MPIAAFGTAAQQYAARFPADSEVVFTDETGIGDALGEAVDRSREGRSFLGAIVVDDARATVAQRLAPQIVVSPDMSQHRPLLDALSFQALSIGGKPQIELSPTPQNVLQGLTGFTFFLDTIMVRSWTEFQLIRSWSDSVWARGARISPLNALRVVVPPETAVPNFRPRSGARTIVIWAPERPAAETAMFAFALAELHTPVTIVCKHPEQGAALGLRARFVGVQSAQEWLDDAMLLIDASISDPASAIALARCGIPLVASSCTGVHEYVDGVVLYEPWSFRSILRSTLQAAASSAPRVHPNLPGPELMRSELAVTRPVVPERTPLVSLVIPTLNRRHLLPRAIESIAKQTYPNIELIVVNDGGAAVDDLVAVYPNARVLNHEVRQGVTPSLNDGLAIARGEYIGFLADDDYLFAEHMTRSVGALERSGASVSHSLIVASYLTVDDDGYYDLLGHNPLAVAVADASEAMVTNIFGVPTVLYHRRIFENLGPYDLGAKQGADYELLLRILKSYDFILVPVVTANVDFRKDKSQISGYMADENVAILEYLYAKYPVPGRQDIEQARLRTKQFYSTSAGDPSTGAPMFPLTAPRRRQYRLRDQDAAATPPLGGRSVLQ